MGEQIADRYNPSRQLKVNEDGSIDVKISTASNINIEVGTQVVEVNLDRETDNVDAYIVGTTATDINTIANKDFATQTTLSSVASNQTNGNQTTGIFGNDTPSVDAFGRWRTSDTGQRLDVEFIYDKQEEIVDTVIVGSSDAVHQANSRDVLLSIGDVVTGNSAGLYTYDVPYTAGNSQLVEITGVLDNANIGGGTAEVFLRTNVTGSVVETTYEQDTWETNTTGINWNFAQIFMVDFQSLKVGRIRFFLNQGGSAVKVKEIVNDNIRNTGYWQLPSLPAYWRIYNDATYTYCEVGYGDTLNGIGFRYKITKDASATMKAICATVKSEGGLNIFDMPGYSRSVDLGVTERTVSSTIIPLIAIRPATTFNSLPNRSIAFPKDSSVITDNPIKIMLYHNNGVSVGTWAPVDATQSAMEYNITAGTVSNGHVLWSEYVGAGKNANVAVQNALGRALLWNRRDGETGYLTLAAVKTGATDASVLASMIWKELR